jgi:hypothetical protein
MMKALPSVAIPFILAFACILAACDQPAENVSQPRSATAESDRSQAREAAASSDEMHRDLEAIRRELVAIREALEKSAPPPSADHAPDAVAPASDWPAIVKEAEARAVAAAVIQHRMKRWGMYLRWDERAKQAQPHGDDGRTVEPALCAEFAQMYRNQIASLDNVRTLQDLVTWEQAQGIQAYDR